MNSPSRNGQRGSLPFTAKLGEIAGPMPESVTSAVARRNHLRRRPRLTASAVLTAIAADAIEAAGGSANIVSVPPAAPGDPTLLFLRSRGQTCVMVAVAPHLIRSERLRCGNTQRDPDAEREFEMLRVAEAEGVYEDNATCDELLETHLDDDI